MTAHDLALLVLCYGLGYSLMRHGNIGAALGGWVVVGFFAQQWQGYESAVLIAYIAKPNHFDYYKGMAYSLDFRRKVLAVRERDQLTIAQVAERFAVGKASVMRWIKRPERKRLGGRQRKLDLAALAQDIQTYPDAYQYERAARLGVRQSTIWYALKHTLRVVV